MTMHRPCLLLSCALMLGIMLGVEVTVPILLVMMIALFFILGRHWVMLFIVIGVMLINGHMQRSPFLSGEVRGVIDNDIEQSQLLGKAHQTFLWRYQYGYARVHYAGKQRLNYGDEIILNGTWFRRPLKFQRFDDHHRIFWQIYVKQANLKVISHGHGNLFKAMAYRIKHCLRDSLVRYIEPAYQGTLIAMLLGDRYEMEKEFQEVFKRTGVSHILAISGMNMTVITMILLGVFKFSGISRRYQLLIVMMILWVYTLATGLSASVVRACLMATIMLVARIINEESDLLNSLGLSACILLLYDPGNLFDIGFQLSFAAVLGLICWTNSIESLFSFIPLWLARSLAASIAASSATAPLLLYHFGSFTPISIFTNILIVPLADIIIGFAFLVTLISLVMPWVAFSLAAFLNLLFTVLIWIVYGFSLIPGGYWQIW